MVSYYYVLPNTTELYCCTVKNGATQLLANNASNLDLEISDEILYNITKDGAIVGINLKTSKQTFHSEPVGATELAAGGESLCYSPGQPGQIDGIYRINLTDGTSEKIWDDGAFDFTAVNGKVYVMADDLGDHGFIEIDESGTQKILEITNDAN